MFKGAIVVVCPFQKHDWHCNKILKRFQLFTGKGLENPKEDMEMDL